MERGEISLIACSCLKLETSFVMKYSSAMNKVVLFVVFNVQTCYAILLLFVIY